MKRFMFFALCISLFASSCSPNNKGKKTTSDMKWLTTNGRFIVNKADGEKRILRGVNVSGMEYDSTGQGVPIADLMALADNWKINIVRLPINQQWWLNDENGNYRQLITERIDSLKSRNIYTIFDLQWINTMVKISPLPNQQSVELMRQVALMYWKGILNKNLPLLIGEIGPEEPNYNNEEQLAAFIDPHLTMIDSLGLGYTAWSWHDKPYLTKNGSGRPDSLTIFGKRIFENLQKYPGN